MVGKNKAAGEFVMLNHSFFEVNFVGVTKKKNSTFAIPNKKWKNLEAFPGK